MPPDTLEAAVALAGRPPGLLIDGDWITDARRFAVIDPNSGDAFAEVPDAGAREARAAILSADRACAAWGSASGRERYEVLDRAAHIISKRATELAVLVTLETGKPLSEAEAELKSTIGFFEWYAQEALRLNGDYWPAVGDDRDALVVKEPIGLTVAITPWNFPSFLVACKIAPALAAGCPVVLKPAEQTPLSALAIARALQDAGLPGGVLNVVTTSDAQSMSEVLLTSPEVRCITFTGSRPIGSLILAAAAPGIKRVLLELGGSAPAIVLDDADVDGAVEALLRARFANSGQTCTAVNRIYVHEAIADAFVAQYAKRARALRIGDAFSDGTQLGPLIDAEAVDRILDQVVRAVEDGGRIATGGGRARSAGPFHVEPTVIDMADQQSVVSREEIFGPVAFVHRFTDVDAAVRLADDTDFGLSAYVFGADQARALRIARRLSAGSVAVNGALRTVIQLPFGGMRASGLGRERGHAGIEEFLELKTIHLVHSEGTP